MIVGCPSCQTKFRLDDEKFVADIRLRCTKCRAIFKVVKKDAPVAPAPPSAPVPSQSRLRVFVAHESQAFCAAVHKVLANEPFDVRSFTDGLEVYSALGTDKPDVLLLDVALPSMFGFEVCENIRREPDLAGIKTILIAAIYDKTRYKRTPASLYGADDYIEKHHIPDELAAKIYRLTSGQQQEEEPQQQESGAEAPKQEPSAIGVAAPPSPVEQAAQQNAREEIKHAETRETTAAPVAAPAEESEAHVKARRFARIIVSDIALYNQAKVEQGVRAGTFYELLADDIAEGRAIYAQRVAADIRSTTNYLDEALDALVVKKKKEFNL